MDPQLEQRKRDIQQYNKSVGLLENLKKYLASLTSNFLAALKSNIFKVEVTNQKDFPTEMEVTVKNPAKDYSEELTTIAEAVKAIPKTEPTSIEPVLEMLQKLLDRPQKDFPSYDDKQVVEALNNVQKAVDGLPNCMPKMEIKEPEKVDMSKVESALDQMVELMTPKPMKMEKVKEMKLPELIEDGVIRDGVTGEILGFFEEWTDKRVEKKAVKTYKNGNEIKTWKTEVKKR